MSLRHARRGLKKLVGAWRLRRRRNAAPAAVAAVAVAGAGARDRPHPRYHHGKRYHEQHQQQPQMHQQKWKQQQRKSKAAIRRVPEASPSESVAIFGKHVLDHPHLQQQHHHRHHRSPKPVRARPTPAPPKQPQQQQQQQRRQPHRQQLQLQQHQQLDNEFPVDGDIDHTDRFLFSPPHGALALGGCGWLSPFQIGVAGEIGHHFKTVYGVSGGALGAVAGACVHISEDGKIRGKNAGPLAFEEALEAQREMVSFANESTAGGIWRIEDALRTALQRYLPETIGTMCTGYLRIPVSRVTTDLSAMFEIVDEFRDKQDVIDVLCATCHIPLWLSPRLTTTFRGRRAYDGGLPHVFPLAKDIETRAFPYPHTSWNAVKPRRPVHISTDLNPDCEYSTLQLVKLSFVPATQPVFDKFIRWGRDAAASYAYLSGLVRHEQTVHEK